MLTEISPIEGNVCNFKKGSSCMAYNYAIENLPASLESCEPLHVTMDSDLSNSPIIPDILGNSVLVGALNSISIVESSERGDDEGEVNVAFDNAFETEFPLGTSSTHQRSRNKQKTQTKKKLHRYRKIAKKKLYLDTIFLKVARRRRSFLCNRARTSAWGLLGNITQAFDQNIGLVVDENIHKKSRRGKGGRENRKSNTNKASGNLQKSNAKNCVPTSGIRLKVKLGKAVNQNCFIDMVPVIGSDHDKCWQTGIEFPKLTCTSNDKLKEDVSTIRGSQLYHGDLGKGMSLDTSILDVQPADKDQEGAMLMEKLAGKNEDEHVLIPCQKEFEGSGVAVDNSYLYAGTSPDSEVINLIPDGQVDGKIQKNLHNVPTSSQVSGAPGDVPHLDMPQTSRKKGQKKGTVLHAVDCFVENRSGSPEILKKDGKVETCEQRETCPSEASLSTTTTGNASGNSASSDGPVREPLSLSRATEFGISSKTSKADIIEDVILNTGFDVGMESQESQNFQKLLSHHTKTNGIKLSKGSKSKGANSSRSEVPDLMRNTEGKACKQKDKPSKLANKSRRKEKGDFKQITCKEENLSEKGDHTLDVVGQNNTGDRSISDGIYNSEVVQMGAEEQCIPARNAWVCCDDCFKWRRILATLCDSIEATNCRWTCKDNVDKSFADCSTPQEKSNAAINAELDISDVSGEEDVRDARFGTKKLEQKKSKVPQKSSWKLIKSNMFLHRNRKNQTLDEVMVCQCKPPIDGRRGCRDGCLNRMLNIECVRGTCPCGELCSNQQFQKRKYAQLSWFPCGKKGYGLQVQEDIIRGRFLIEYVGEVLDMHAYEARQKEYALNGHKHFYFMTLNGSEVIDACAKGNMGRFINHSCDPNCRTEKWMVNGEVCIGLFALRDIKKGEEVTFDYNYVRVFGAAAKKCVCGSSQCRGYLGGDPSNSEVIVQGDSDEEYIEPAMVYEDAELGDNMDNLISVTDSFDGSATQIAENMVRNNSEVDKPITVVGCLEPSLVNQTEEIVSNDKDELDKSSILVGDSEIAKEIKKCSSLSPVTQSQSEVEAFVGELPCVQAAEASLHLDDVISKTTSAVHQEVSAGDESLKKNLNEIISKSLSDSSEAKRKSKSDRGEDAHAAHSFIKTKRSSTVAKKGKPIKNVSKSQVTAQKPHMLPCKPKKLVEGSLSSRFEAVEEKLNELLDAEGGINKRKEAPKGYLKLLLLTAASSDSSNGEAIQSNRDLSMILDALLKTKSRMVLLDIINKNGLQMLHNVMKRYRRDFNKIPILRKLLKVLEYLAIREILTLEHITGGPLCPGVESFRESMLELTEHIDKQVHQIARNFRDRWIPWQFRKISCIVDKDDGKMDTYRGPNCHNNFSASQNSCRDHQGLRSIDTTIDCTKQSAVTTVPVDPGISESVSASGTSDCALATNGVVVRTRKRKSRWDQPAKTPPRISQPPHEIVADVASLDPVNSTREEDIDEDVPPGFSSPCNVALVSANNNTGGTHTKCDSEMVVGYPQERFISRLPVSFGIPLSVVQQFGTPQTEETLGGWVTAPGMPFHPFPPLPPYPRDSRDHPPNCSAKPMMNMNHHQPTTHHHVAQEIPSTSGGAGPPPHMEIPGPNVQNNFQHSRGGGGPPSNSLGRRYFRQQKWNNPRAVPPWLRNRNNGWGAPPTGNNGMMCSSSVGVGNVAGNELNGPYNSSEDRSNASSSDSGVWNNKTFYQQPPLPPPPPPPQHQNFQNLH